MHGRIRACMCGRAVVRSRFVPRGFQSSGKTYKARPEYFSSLDALHGERMRYNIPCGKIPKSLPRCFSGYRRETRKLVNDRGKWHSKPYSYFARYGTAIPPYIDPILSAIAIKSILHRIRHDVLSTCATTCKNKTCV